MTEHERTGQRDLTYSAWHRSDSTSRFLGGMANRLAMIDLDGVEYCKSCGRPVALIEVKHCMATRLSMAVTKALAAMAGIPAYLVRYWPTPEGGDIATFAVRNGTDVVREMRPAQYAEWLLSLREPPYHHCRPP